jgi:hypothetical protein
VRFTLAHRASTAFRAAARRCSGVDAAASADWATSAYGGPPKTRTPAEDVKSLYLGVTQPPMIRVVLIALPSGGGRLLRGVERSRHLGAGHRRRCGAATERLTQAAEAPYPAGGEDLMPDKICFVIAPIGEDGSDIRKRSDRMFTYVIEPAAKECGYKAVRADKISKPGIITNQVIQAHIFDLTAERIGP